jgi:hemerythrin-like metal-binding protein
MKPFISLAQDFLLGISLMDDQHQKMANRINALADAVSQDLPGEQRIVLLKDLINESFQHFRDEESLMEKSGCQEFLELHQTLHKALLKKLEELSLRVDQGALLINQDFMNYLSLKPLVIIALGSL